LDIETSSSLAHQRGALGVYAQVELQLRVEMGEGMVAAGCRLGSVQALQSWVRKAVREVLRGDGVHLSADIVTVCDLPSGAAEVGCSQYVGRGSILDVVKCVCRGVRCCRVPCRDCEIT
jgi:hypothetical protein